MKKRLYALILCIALVFCVLCGCEEKPNEKPPENPGNNQEQPEEKPDDSQEQPEEKPDPLAESLKSSLRAYFATDSFKESVERAKTAAAWVPLSYLKYVDGNFHTFENARICLKYLNMIDELTVKDPDGDYTLSDSKWSASAACAQGWYGITDYLYTYSICANIYAQYCRYNGITDTHFDFYKEPISNYLAFVDAWQGNSSKTYDIRWVSGDTITQSNLYYQGYNCFNSASRSRLKDYAPDYWTEFMGIVATATGSTDGHEAFLKAYGEFWQEFETMTDAKMRAQAKELLKLFKDCLPVTQVAFGYSAYSHIACIKSNLGLDTPIPFTDRYFLSYYEKNEDGTWKKEGGTPNWVGPSGRPIGASLYKDRKEYSLDYEKSMQGYFPFTDGWSQPLDEMINLDRLCNYYNHELGTGANVTPQWALLTAMMHGIDFEHYKKAEPLVDEEKNVHETGDEIFNVITLWRNNLKKDEQDNYIISGNIDAAVAIAYLAKHAGIDAPTPLGVYSPADAVISLQGAENA